MLIDRSIDLNFDILSYFNREMLNLINQADEFVDSNQKKYSGLGLTDEKHKKIVDHYEDFFSEEEISKIDQFKTSLNHKINDRLDYEMKKVLKNKFRIKV